MPSPRHDTINKLFRERPEAAVEILRDLMGVDVPAIASVRLERNDFNDRPSKDFQPDTVITVGSAQAPIHGIVVEVQQVKAAEKRRQLPRYAAALWLMLRCPVTVLCVCLDRDVAAWYAQPTPTDLPGFVFRAMVLGPREIPMITDRDEIIAHPELAAMGVVIHGRDRRVAEAFVRAMETLKNEHAPQYYEYAYSMAAPAVRRILEELMPTDWPVHSPFAREHFGRGKAEGREEGRVAGRQEGEAAALLRVLTARGIEVPEDVRARILACADARQIETWLDRAVVAISLGEVFA
jgi:hypothetical protein